MVKGRPRRSSFETEDSVTDLELNPDKYLPFDFKKRFEATSAPQLHAIRKLLHGAVFAQGAGTEQLYSLCAAVNSAVDFQAKILTDDDVKAITQKVAEAVESILQRRARSSSSEEKETKKKKKQKKHRVLPNDGYSYAARDHFAGQYYGRVRKPLAE